MANKTDKEREAEDKARTDEARKAAEQHVAEQQELQTSSAASELSIQKVPRQPRHSAS